MSSAEEREDHDMYCEKAVALIIDLCLDDSPLLQPNTCQDFITLLATNQSPNSAGSAVGSTALLCLNHGVYGQVTEVALAHADSSPIKELCCVCESERPQLGQEETRVHQSTVSPKMTLNDVCILIPKGGMCGCGYITGEETEGDGVPRDTEVPEKAICSYSERQGTYLWWARTTQDLSFSLLLLVFVACGLGLLGVIVFASWKLCWVHWRTKDLSSSATVLASAPPLLRL
ncbi:hypothetical protein J4Q44_G00105820 [Coregonus suidteri]|uniref:Uncharacterized protein n=1 Tax=Coregonus suidteri TaxID=861788 RepID=A0AAN8R0E5_9TELE